MGPCFSGRRVFEARDLEARRSALRAHDMTQLAADGLFENPCQSLNESLRYIFDRRRIHAKVRMVMSLASCWFQEANKPMLCRCVVLWS